MTLTEQMKADGWIEHDGSEECPVDPNSAPDVLFRGHNKPVMSGGGKQRKARWLRWEYAPLAPASDIIAYKPEQPQ